MLAKPDKPFEFVVDPHQLVESEEELRRLAAISCARLKPHQRHLTLRHVTIIGTQSVDFNRLHEDRDSARLALALRYLMKSGVPVSPDFVVDCVDFRDRRDFLEETGSTDVVFASYLRGRPSQSSRHYGPGFEAAVHEDFYGSIGADKELAWAYYHAQSRHTEYDGWRRRVRASGAKIFMAYGGAIEVGTDHVATPMAVDPFATIIANPDVMDADVRTRNLSLSYVYPYAEKLDLPMLWLGIAMRKTYGRELQKVIGKADTFMSRRILTLFRPGHVKPVQDADLGLVALWRRKGLLPALRTVLKLESDDIRLDGLKRKDANAKRNRRPQNGVYP